MRQESPLTATVGKIDREPILLLINFVVWQPHRGFLNFGSAA
jgi:hypothetical protein